MSPTEKFKNHTVLYVEDETVIRNNVKNCLKYIFNVIVAKDGQEGIDCFNNNQIDLIITDINMPIKDGLEMLKEIKIKNPNIPCIVTTAYDLETISKFDEKLVCKYMTKPFDIKDLLDNSIEILENNNIKIQE